MAWGYTRAVVIDYTKVSTTNHTDFPALIKLDSSNVGTTLKSVANGGHVQSATGYDIYFYSDEALTTRIPAGRISYDATNGVWLGRVKIGTLSCTVNTTIYVAYGDSGISTDPNVDATYGMTSVWNSSYKAAYGLGDGSTLDLTDQTANANTLTNNGTATAVAGQVSGGVSLNGSSQYLSRADNAGLSITGALTLEAWVKIASAPTGASKGVVSKYRNESPDLTNRAYSLGIVVTSALFAGWISVNGSAFKQTNSTTAVGTGAWHHIAMVFTPSTSIKLYYDGTEDKVDTASIPASIYDGSAPLWIGCQYDTNGKLAGQIDEPRVHATNRSAGWIITTYTNEYDPLAFLASVATETDLTGGAAFQPAWAIGSNQCI